MSQGRDTIVTYRGPSVFDPTSIIFSALTVGSDNAKTGNMPQQYIFRQDRKPTVAIKSGLDFALCGCCAARSFDLGGCYVHGYQQRLDGYWKAWRDRPVATDEQILHTIGYRPVRLGAYGDTAAMPPDDVLRLVRLARGRVTNYTHGHLTLGWAAVEWMRHFTMLSVESEDEAREAWRRGWRTYRVTPKGGRTVKGHEIPCPFPPEQCYGCLLCDGAKNLMKKSITVEVHGSKDSIIPKMLRVLARER